MNRFIFLLMLIAFVACSKEVPPADPHDATRIEGGVWAAMLPAHPDWRYEFRQGLLRQYALDYGIVLSDQTYMYALRSDTVFIGGSGPDRERRWVVFFHCDSLVECRTKSSGVLAPTLFLKRMQ